MTSPSPADEALLETVQRQTFRYFWEFGHPVSGLARDRHDPHDARGDDVCTIGGTGFAVMAIIVAAERGWITRAEALARLRTIAGFLAAADHYHGIFPHFMHGGTGRTIRFSRKDDGADIVETSLLIAGLLCARHYFDGDSAGERALRGIIQQLWLEAEWNWHTRGGRELLYWHWSPNHGWAMGHEIRGWNECLITYLLAAASPTFPVDPEVYHRGWANGREFVNGREFFGTRLPLGPDLGGPLFFAHYSFMGLDPRGLRDRYADYWEQNVRHTRINHDYCVANPRGFAGYGPDCWGLTASDDHAGYVAHAPNEDTGVISPTAAISSLPYLPEEAMRAMRHFHGPLGERIWRDYGFTDGFSVGHDWYARTHLAIDQGPIVVMIENFRSGLMWRLFMQAPEIHEGLRRLGFQSPHLVA
ncbi:glucoamylase family protein [Marinimicrococcus flavescens]|uniref:Glucoamylase family protein n=1 Tax=Marinimicrococcus flavescens TaxID=3031815 RepID=A0AAP3UY15_9PROT|nr:glucoamylase family protein [Marinimicrococcus flavescens]